MRETGLTTPRRVAVALTVALAIAGTTPAGAGADDRVFRFAVEMAEAGNWREALYRWEQLAGDAPDDPRLLNNIAVALEAVGEPDRALETYRRALEAEPDDRIVRDNVARATRFWSTVRGETIDRDSLASMAGKPADPGRRAKRLPVSLPVPAKLDLGERRYALVASFLTGDDEVMDSNREMVQYLRAELGRRTPLEVRDVVPAPAIPEQTLDDLAANREFWKYLGRRHDADVILSGKIEYDRRDASGFRDVDTISPATGQKVRRSQFTEAEEFRYRVVLLFLDGRTGELLHRDAITRAVVYTGMNNDPLTAFFELSRSLSDDVLSVITPQTKVDPRIIYKR